MAERFNNKRNAVYECVDKDAESISGSIANINANLMVLYSIMFKLNLMVSFVLLMTKRKS